jgi:hypothetical protein
MQVEKYLDDNLSVFPEGLKASIRTAIANIDSNAKWLVIHDTGLQEFFASL